LPRPARSRGGPLWLVLVAILIAGLFGTPAVSVAAGMDFKAPETASQLIQGEHPAAPQAVRRAADAFAPSIDPDIDAPDPGLQPTIHYEEARAHEHDRLDLPPGGRVTVGFSPRSTDNWTVDGRSPVSLPAGSASGKQMLDSRQGSTWTSGESHDASTGEEPDAQPAAAGGIATAGAVTTSGAGLLRQVFGFLPYWELSDTSTRLSYDVLSTIAYFSVGADSKGNLLKRNADGSITTGWRGWTSAKLTSVISDAHRHHTRVVLTLSVFAWTSSQKAKQAAILGSSTARLNLARQAAAAVRDRGADGVNLDFEPIASGYAEEFTAFVRTLRAELNKIRSGYQLTFDTTGYIGNYPLEAATASGGADAIFVMGYDYRTAGSSPVGSISPLAGPRYDLTDTVRAYLARVPASRLILGVPYYGRAWSTSSDRVNATNISGTKYGPSASVVYTTAVDYAGTYGRRWDSIQHTPWVAYRRQNCTATYGCVTAWRQIYYDDVTSLKQKYDMILRYGLRGVGIWALGYDGTRTELNNALASKFVHDTTPPTTGIRLLSPRQRNLGIIVGWTGFDVNGIRSYDVQVSIDAGGWRTWRTGTTATSDVYLGREGHGYAFRVRGRDNKGNLGSWTVANVWRSSPKLAVGGFAVATVDGLAMRTAPDTSATKTAELSRTDLVSVIGGPRSADGFTWWLVAGPLREWRPVSQVYEGLWVAAGPSASPYLIAGHAPSTALVDPIIGRLSFGGGNHSFSPNADGSRDVIQLSWRNAQALDSLRLDVYRPDGTLVDRVALADTAAGDQSYSWTGVVDGARLPDRAYAIALIGSAGSATYCAPSCRPVTASQIAAYGVTIDTVPPVLASSSISTTAFSPNGDGVKDSVATALTATGVDRWAFSASPIIAGVVGTPVQTASGMGPARTTWNGRRGDGTRAPDGRYRVTLRALDAAGNSVSRTWDVTLDTRPAVVTASLTLAAFSPNGDGAADSTRLSWTADERISGSIRVGRAGTTWRSWAISGAGALTWSGRDGQGDPLPDGHYTLSIGVRDPAGNLTVRNVLVLVDRTAGYLRWSPSLFYPQDGDRLAPAATASFRLARTATTTLRIYDASGAFVRTLWADRSLRAGTWWATWNGRNASGSMVPRGRYRLILTARSLLGTTKLSRSVVVDAFAISLSRSPLAGQTLTLTLRSAEPLSVGPRVTLSQAGRTVVTRSATALGDRRYAVTFALPAGVTGSATFSIAARDVDGHAVSQRLTVTVR
jgi:spore germination protein YaaH/flagellar hook assembly protein FlgD